MENFKTMTKEEYVKLNNGQLEGFYITINCNYIQTWEQLAEALGNAFQFPMRNEGFDATWDWMTDFSWSEIVNKSTITIYFNESRELFKSNSKLKAKVFDFFERIIDHWKDASNLGFINGKPGVTKDIVIYLVD